MDTTSSNSDIQPLDGCKQRYLILALLRQGPINSIELRQIGILNPTARLSEIKQKGYPVKVRLLPAVIGPSGLTHRNVAQYRLEPPSE